MSCNCINKEFGRPFENHHVLRGIGWTFLVSWASQARPKVVKVKGCDPKPNPMPSLLLRFARCTSPAGMRRLELHVQVVTHKPRLHQPSDTHHNICHIPPSVQEEKCYSLIQPMCCTAQHQQPAGWSFPPKKKSVTPHV